MKDAKSNISQSQSYQEIGEYCDNHDLDEMSAQTESADFVLSGHTKTTSSPAESTLSQKLYAELAIGNPYPLRGILSVAQREQAILGKNQTKHS